MRFLECVDLNPRITMTKGQIYPFVEMANVSTCYRSPDKVDAKPFDSGVKFQDGDTVIARITPCLQNGKRFYCQNIGTGFGSTEYLVFRPKDDSVDSKYLYYFMMTDFVKQSMINSMTGATGRQRVNNDVFNDIEVCFPDIDTQRKIGEILSAYDTLIENNQKQIKLLEEAAQRLYKEWFVDLRFPGHEDTPIIDGVPEGWEKLPLSQFISFEIGGGWGEETATGKNVIEAFVIRGTDFYGISNGEITTVPFRYHTESNLSSRKLQDGDLIFEVSGGSKTEGVARSLLITSDLLNRYGYPVICASFCKKIRPIEGFSFYLYYTFKYMRKTGKTEEYDKRSASSIVNYRWKDFLSQELLLLPPKDTMREYNSISKMFYKKLINCSLNIESAIKARDRLLPKLMSGEIEI